jgi:hypothetical protein
MREEFSSTGRDLKNGGTASTSTLVPNGGSNVKSAVVLNTSVVAKSQLNALQSAEEIRIIKEKIEEERNAQERIDEDIKGLQQEIID